MADTRRTGDTSRDRYHCECPSFDCGFVLDITQDEFGSLHTRGFITNPDCQTPPEPGDTLLEATDRYKLWKPALGSEESKALGLEDANG